MPEVHSTWEDWALFYYTFTKTEAMGYTHTHTPLFIADVASSFPTTSTKMETHQKIAIGSWVPRLILSLTKVWIWAPKWVLTLWELCLVGLGTVEN